ncbi:MAG: AMP nucleosidase, partial [Rhodanobacteraceae bacterium]
MKDKLEIVRDWLPRYTGQALEAFSQFVLLTNFIGYLETFCRLTGATIVDRERPMPCATADGLSM